MTWECVTTEAVTARKDYPCQAMEWINSCDLEQEDFTPEEWEQIEQARAEGNRILKGQNYLKTRGKWEGDWDTFRARPEIDAICHKYDIYQE